MSARGSTFVTSRMAMAFALVMSCVVYQSQEDPSGAIEDEMVTPLPSEVSRSNANDRAPELQNGHWLFSRARVEGTSVWKESGGELTVALDADDPSVMTLRANNQSIAIRRNLGAAAGGHWQLEQNRLVQRTDTNDLLSTLYHSDSGVEELVQLSSAHTIQYQCALPARWRLHAVPALPNVIELRDGGDRARARVRFDAAWDSAGQLVPLVVDVIDDSILVRVEGTPSFPVTVDPLWTGTGQPIAEHELGSYAPLGNGKLLIAGGGEQGSVVAELYDVATGTFTAAGMLNTPRYGATSTVTLDGRVIVAGGKADMSTLDSVELYDPSSDTFLPVGSLVAARYYHTATRLDDGSVLVTGGRVNLGGSAVFEILSSEGQSIEQGLAIHPRVSHTATKLPDGRVLLVGGDFPGSSAELYEPGVGFRELPPTSFRYEAHVAVALSDGRVLVAGGRYTNQAEVWDPVSETFSVVGSMSDARADTSAALLPNGRVLIAGGVSEDFTSIRSSEVFDPETGQFLAPVPLPSLQGSMPASAIRGALTPLADGNAIYVSSGPALRYETSAWRLGAAVPMTTPRFSHSAATLLDGRVLLAGGCADAEKVNCEIASAELLDPTTGESLATGSLLTPRSDHTMNVLDELHVVVCGGVESAGPLASCEQFDLRTQTWSPAGALTEPRYGHTSTRLPSGRLLVVGGIRNSPVATSEQSRDTIELYDPVTQTSSIVAKLETPRSFHTASLLPSGQVLIAGGGSSFTMGNPIELDTAELYDPTTNSIVGSLSMLGTRSLHTASALSDGRVFLFGGKASSSELYDPQSNSFTLVTTDAWRWQAFAVPLLDGQVLHGGGNPEGTLPSNEVRRFDPFAGGIVVEESLSRPRFGGRTALLRDGSVIVTGGLENLGEDIASDSAEMVHDERISPVRVRPWITQVSSSITAGQLITLEGGSLIGPVEGSGGYRVGAANQPTVLFKPLEGAVQYATVERFDDESLNFRLPPTVFTGPGFLYVATAGVRSLDGVPVFVEPAALGVSCELSATCASSACVDGVCCENSCDDRCEQCDATGLCVAVPSGEPEEGCASDDSCQTGTCDGNRNCGVEQDGTSCDGPGACLSGACVATTCDGDHTIQSASGSVDCGAYRCSLESNACLERCDSLLDCTDGFVCGAAGDCVIGPADVTVVGCDGACALRPAVSSPTSGTLALVGLLMLGTLRRRRRRCLSERQPGAVPRPPIAEPLNAQALHLVVQRPNRDLEQLRGAGLAPARLSQSGQDQLALGVAQGLTQRAGRVRGCELGLPRLRADALGEIVQRDDAARAHHQGALDHVSKLADVARPAVGHQRSQGLCGEVLVRKAVVLDRLFDEVARQRRQVRGPLTKWRNLQRHCVQPEIEVCAKRAPRDQGIHVSMRGRQYANVDRDFACATHPHHVPGFEHAQQRNLHWLGQLRDFIEQKGAAVCSFEQAKMLRDGSRECAAFVPEQRALHQLRGNRSAVHGHERACSSWALVVEGAGEHLLAGACLAGDQHRYCEATDSVHSLQELLHGGTLRHCARQRPHLFRSKLLRRRCHCPTHDIHDHLGSGAVLRIGSCGDSDRAFHPRSDARGELRSRSRSQLGSEHLERGRAEQRQAIHRPQALDHFAQQAGPSGRIFSADRLQYEQSDSPTEVARPLYLLVQLSQQRVMVLDLARTAQVLGSACVQNPQARSRRAQGDLFAVAQDALFELVTAIDEPIGGAEILHDHRVALSAEAGVVARYAGRRHEQIGRELTTDDEGHSVFQDDHRDAIGMAQNQERARVAVHWGWPHRGLGGQGRRGRAGVTCARGRHRRGQSNPRRVVWQ